MITAAKKGFRTRRLVEYLFGPGRAEEHTSAPTNAEREAKSADRTADAALQEGVWHDASPEVAKAGLSSTRR